MNCNTCRYELSQCLDGRLPSGRRTLVLQHAESCSACGQFWNDLQAAQHLTLRLRTSHVDDGFRERLWERIRAGEGTPEAVFHEPVPLLTKLRYTLTGAAAAAAALLAVTMFRRASEPPRAEIEPVANVERATPPAPSAPVAPQAQPVVLAHDPLMSATQPLTFNLFAVETARQLEHRHAAVATALRQLDNPRGNRDFAIRQAFDNAADFCAFGELLLDLRDRDRLQFTDNSFDADLRFAVRLLKLGEEQQRDLRTVETVVAPALRSERLGKVCNVIAVRPTIDRQEEIEVLRRLTRLRPEVFPKLFVVLGNEAEWHWDVRSLPGNLMFQIEDACGPSWVAPRSEVEASEMLLQTVRRQRGR